jgi:hypothetical protein
VPTELISPLGPSAALVSVGDWFRSSPSSPGSGPAVRRKLRRQIAHLWAAKNRHLNHAVHMVAVTQIRNLRTEGLLRAQVDREQDGQRSVTGAQKTYQRLPLCGMVADAAEASKDLLVAAGRAKWVTALLPARPAHTPLNRLFGQATRRPSPSLELRTLPGPSGHLRRPEEALETKKKRGLVRYFC